MEQYYRSKLHDNKLKESSKKDLLFQVAEWFVEDAIQESESEQSDDSTTFKKSKERKNYVVRAFGSTLNGQSVTCKITGYTPFYYIKVDDAFSSTKERNFLDFVEQHYLISKFENPLVRRKCKLIKRKDIFGFSNNKYFNFIRLVFESHEAMRRSRYIFKKAISIPGVNQTPRKFTLYESNFEPFMRLAHLKDIQMAGWLKVPLSKSRTTSSETSCGLEVEIDWNHIVAANDVHKVANFLQASWDIEVYSYDRSFPDPKLKVSSGDNNTYPNQIIQIATTYKYFKDKEIMIKHLLTLKQCAYIDDPNVIVESCENEKELIKKWVSTVKLMDPDIFYTYNGDSFDCNYLVERAIICGLAHDSRKKVAGRQTGNVTGWLMNELSRLQEQPCTIQTEYFSSSAYGDNEYNRLYVPGRLNYDLMIHMKRGMKKYPSYKLNYIASEILKEGKNDLPPKKIFEYFDIGTPEKIKVIAEYCIQDTALLQKMVDKQLILTNIIQLANVTSVPISFLTSRGQTIKVFSQILRKARQMEYLVPDTNFNSDAYLLNITFKEEHGFIDDHIGTYLKIQSTSSLPKIDGQYKIQEVIDLKTVVVLTDFELEKDGFFGKCINSRKQTSAVSKISNFKDEEEESFTGATVLEPSPGTYFDDIVVEDFASLYPTIMMAYNLCFSSFVMDDSYLGIPGVRYETIEWNDFVEVKLKHTCDGVGKSGQKKGMVCGKQAFFEVEGKYYCRIHDPIKKLRTEDMKVTKKPVSYKYIVVQPHLDEQGNKINQGVLPALLDELYSERKKVKKQMTKAAQAGDKVLEDILDATQLAIKVSLNSTYGFLGRSQGNLVLKPLASIVTSTGRKMIEQSKEYAEGKFIHFVRDNQLAVHTLQKLDLSHLSIEQKSNILKRFKKMNPCTT